MHRSDHVIHCSENYRLHYFAITRYPETLVFDLAALVIRLCFYVHDQIQCMFGYQKVVFITRILFSIWASFLFEAREVWGKMVHY